MCCDQKLVLVYLNGCTSGYTIGAKEGADMRRHQQQARIRSSLRSAVGGGVAGLLFVGAAVGHGTRYEPGAIGIMLLIGGLIAGAVLTVVNDLREK